MPADDLEQYRIKTFPKHVCSRLVVDETVLGSQRAIISSRYDNGTWERFGGSWANVRGVTSDTTAATALLQLTVGELQNYPWTSL